MPIQLSLETERLVEQEIASGRFHSVDEIIRQGVRTHALSASVVKEFCNLCNRSHELWLNHLELFDNNPRFTELMKSIAGCELKRLYIISQEYTLLQIRKLHDKAVMNGTITLGIDYIIKYGGWSDSVRDLLEELEKELDGFASQLRDVRNKILSHYDLTTILAGAPLGMFAAGADEKYFKALQEFVNIVHDQVIGGPYPFSHNVKNDIAYFFAYYQTLIEMAGCPRSRFWDLGINEPHARSAAAPPQVVTPPSSPARSRAARQRRAY